MRLAAAGLALMPLAGQGGATACEPGSLALVWPGAQVTFSVEIADDAAERARGLMFRDGMKADHGMLFVYDAPHPVSFWMKNTLIPLDMLFIGADGRVSRIHRMAAPQDETPIAGGESVQYVLEINGGLADRLGIPEGAAVRHAALGPDVAAPCTAP
jgi:hypothetical protein